MHQMFEIIKKNAHKYILFMIMHGMLACFKDHCGD